MTAQEIIEKYSEFRETVKVDTWGSENDVFTSEEVIENMMIEFAKYHIETALKQIYG